MLDMGNRMNLRYIVFVMMITFLLTSCSNSSDQEIDNSGSEPTIQTEVTDPPETEVSSEESTTEDTEPEDTGLDSSVVEETGSEESITDETGEQSWEDYETDNLKWALETKPDYKNYYEWSWNDDFKTIISPIAYGDGFSWRRLTIEEKAALTRAVNEYGADISYKNDGSATIYDRDDSNSIIYLGGDWRSSKYSLMLPVPDNGTMNVSILVNGSGYAFTLAGFDDSSMVHYVKKMHDKGFNNNVKVSRSTDSSSGGVSFFGLLQGNDKADFEYSAEDSTGNKVNLKYIDEVVTVMLEVKNYT